MAQDEEIQEFLNQVGHKLLVMSGKGGVGKSTVAASIAVYLSKQGYQVGLLDVDVHGPTIAGLFGLTGIPLNTIGKKLQPYMVTEHLKVISIQGLLNHADDPIIWRGPLKISIIKQFLSEVDWGKLDFLIIDSPPGTGDEPLTIAQTIKDCQAVVVTTPQEVALADVRKSIEFCKAVNMKVAGLVENMSGFVCPDCGSVHEIFKSGGGEKTATSFNIPFLGKIPLDSKIVEAGDKGDLMTGLTNHSNGLDNVGKNILSLLKKRGVSKMKLAIPMAEGKLAAHFGHCETFAFVQISNNKIEKIEEMVPPPHEPGVIPNWIADQGTDVLLVGGMGEMAQDILKQRGVNVIIGAQVDTPENLAKQYLAGNVVTGSNACDHHEGDHSCNH